MAVELPRLLLISVAPLPVAVAVSPTTSCAGSGAILTSVSTGTTYTWTPGNILTASTWPKPSVNTTYTVVVSDGVCSGMGVVSLSVNPIPTVAVVASSSCDMRRWSGNLICYRR